METLSLKQLSTLLTTPSTQAVNRKNLFLRKAIAAFILATSDIASVFLAMSIAVYLRNLFFQGELLFVDYFSLVLYVMPLFPISFSFRSLYPGFGVDVIEELRSLTYSTTIVFAILVTITFFVQGAWESSRTAFILSWVFCLPLLPLGRALMKKIFGTKTWWGIPVMIIGAGKAGEQVIRSLQKHRHIGLRPIVAVDDDIDRWGYIDKIPVVGGLEIAPELAAKLKIDHAIIAMPSVPKKRQQEIIMNYSRFFTHTTVIPELFGLSSLWVSTRDLGGILGLEVQQSLLRGISRFKKRVFDIVFSSLLILMLLPIYIIISILIRIDSKGKVFFRQKRMGINDSRFRIIKFRTMHIDAESKLSSILEENEELKAEYDTYHKLRNDPRLTRIGKFIRKFSLDELPQFINVLRGEMSLIGPRAYIPWEKKKMNGYEEIILKVKPGISGLWQVTDRNQSSFEERNITDVYYIRNWSMFMDFYIMARTIAVIITGRGG